jgi:hypothetical protein
MPVVAPVVKVPTAKPVVAAPDSVAALSARVAELERWRRSRGE